MIFDWKQYLANYLDIRSSGIKTQIAAWKHYKCIGQKENRTDKLQVGNITFYPIEGYHNLNKKSTKNIFKTSWHTREQMPEEIVRCLQITKYLNPEYTVYYFDNNEMEQSIKDISDEYHKIWLKLKPGAFKSDFWRYLMLYHYGGIYSDIGHEPLISFNQIIENYDMVLVKEYNEGIHNGFMYSSIGNTFLKSAIDKVVSNVNENFYGRIDTDVTGPVMLSKLNYSRYSIKWLDHNIVKKVIPEFYTISHNSKVVMNTKFSNYYHIMYQNTDNYHVLWNDKNIYN
jgi:mannosyltransferase OCH1-like enzyme